jgi:hypothetical protein
MAEPLVIKAFTSKSGVASHPSTSVTVPQGFKILGGGALVDSVEPSNFLTASFPANQQTWFAAGKDHEISSPASITVWAFAVEDPNDIWDVQIRSGTSAALSQPKVNVALTDDYVLTGGGAFVDYRGVGNMLVASYPRSGPDPSDWYIWEAHSKDHEISDPAHLTVYAIGIRLRSAPVNSPGVQNKVNIVGTTDRVDKPQLTLTGSFGEAGIPPLTGGGAFDGYLPGAGNMLTAMGPPGLQPDAWLARGSDHRIVSPATIFLYAITLEAVDALPASGRVTRRRTGEIPPLDSPYLPGSTKP